MQIEKVLSEMDEEDIPKVIEILREEAKGTVNQLIKENSFFAAEVGDQGRITVPSAERSKQDIEKGDLVQVYVRKIKKEK